MSETRYSVTVDELIRRMGGPPENEDITATDLLHRRHSYRGFEPQEFLQAWKNAREIADAQEQFEEEDKLREALAAVEGGRWYPMLEKAYRMAISLDPDELDTFFERNPGLKEWLNVYAVLEEVRRFP